MQQNSRDRFGFTRREALALAGAAGTWLWTGGAPARAAGAAGCIAVPEQTEGPYFVDEKLLRSDIRSDPADGAVVPGVPLRLTLRVSGLRGGNCAPLAGALVDIWHCDASGVYSDVEDPHFNTVGKKFLRGSQRTDAAGSATFTTIYPGWYAGRAVHVHFKLRQPTGERSALEFTSQLYFDDALSDRVLAAPPYTNPGRRRIRNPDDGIFQRGGSQLLLALEPAAEGYAGTFDVALKTA